MLLCPHLPLIAIIRHRQSMHKYIFIIISVLICMYRDVCPLDCVCVRRKMKFEMIIASCLLRYEDGRCRINGNNNCIYAQLISEQCRNESVDLSTIPLPFTFKYSTNSHRHTHYRKGSRTTVTYDCYLLR